MKDHLPKKVTPIFVLCTQLTTFLKWSWKESIGYTMQKSGNMVLKVVNWEHNDKIRSNGLERSQLGTQQ